MSDKEIRRVVSCRVTPGICLDVNTDCAFDKPVFLTAVQAEALKTDLTEALRRLKLSKVAAKAKRDASGKFTPRPAGVADRRGEQDADG